MTRTSALERLAVFGGRPAFDRVLHVGRPNIGDRAAFFHRLDEVLDRRWLTNHGTLVQEFERRIEARLGVRHCVAMCNATLALEIAARACGLTGEVIVPAFTFVATAHALQWIGLTPVFCDIDPATHNIDPAAAAALVTDRTSGIVGVHVWGRPCDVRGLESLASRHGLTLLFDAAHAFACGADGAMIGNFGAAEVFSFHATKFVNSFEGGALVTNDDRLAQRARLMANFGFADVDRVIALGINAKMHEASAAMGLTSLDALDDLIEINRTHHAAYLRALDGLPGVTVVDYAGAVPCNYQYVILELDDAAGLTRDDLRDVLWAENIRARRYFYPGCHNMPPYNAMPPRRPLVHTDRLCRRVLSLPSGTGVSADDVAAIGELIQFSVDHGEAIHDALARAPRMDAACESPAG